MMRRISGEPLIIADSAKTKLRPRFLPAIVL